MSSTLQEEQSLSRRERERLRRRRAMLEAAQAVFAEKGYAQATLDEIAERAEFGKGTLYNYFKGGKEEILFAVFEGIYDEVCTLIRDVFAGVWEREEPLRAAFHTFVEAYFEFFRERPDPFMIVVKEAHRMAFSEDADRVRFFQTQQERMVAALAPSLEAAMERGEIQSLPQHAVAHLLLANVNGMVVHHCLTEQYDAQYKPCPKGDLMLSQPEKAADFLTSMLFDGLALSSEVTDVAAEPSHE